MEIVLQGAEGVPEGGVLSIKIGDTKRQAPISKIGQPFRFSSSPVEPLPLKVELLVPAAPTQNIQLDPVREDFVVDFGNNTRVTLKQRAVQDMQRPPVRIGETAEMRKLPAEKLQMAQTAASYLEHHDLVRTFQDLLHGLLVARPDDPLAFVEEQLSRARRLAQSQAAGTGAGAPLSSATSSPGRSGNKRRPGAITARKTISDLTSAGIAASDAKVDVLLVMLRQTSENLSFIRPFLPDSLQQMMQSEAFAQECASKFAGLDKRCRGALEPTDLLEIIVELSSVQCASITLDQCRQFAMLFDSDKDGLISLSEFNQLVQFVMVTAFLQTPEGKAAIDDALVQENHFADFIEMVAEDQDRLWALMPFLPQWLLDHITSPNFQRDCLTQFDSLDKDRNGVLDPMELLPVISSLCSFQSASLDLEKCKKFVALFDYTQNGVIMKDEFVCFAQFLAVMNFLQCSAEGTQVKEQAELVERSKRTAQLIDLLTKSPGRLRELIQHLPRVMASELMSESFAKAAMEGYKECDPEGRGVVPFEVTFLLLTRLCKQGVDLLPDECREHAIVFDPTSQALARKESFVELARYVIVMSYLNFVLANQEILAAEVLLGRERILRLLFSLKDNLEHVTEVIPYLPTDLSDEIMSQAFVASCIERFTDLDRDSNGVLSAKELLPVIRELTQVHDFAITEDHGQRFLELFDTGGSGALTQAEFIALARFMLIMSFMESQEGQLIRTELEVNQATGSVDQMLRNLAKDREFAYKILPLLPKEFYDYVTSDEFTMLCHKNFVELDLDANGSLRPSELLPMIVDITHAQKYAVTEEQCQQFTSIFDVYGDGVLQQDEFLDFARFLSVMAYLQNNEGKEHVDQALRVMDNSKRADELIEMLERDRDTIQLVMPYLPDPLNKFLLSESFTVDSIKAFRDLDVNRNGTLEPDEIFPVIQSLANVQDMALDMSLCKRFTAIWDDSGQGVIRQSDYVKFSRYLVVASYLHQQNAQVVFERSIDNSLDRGFYQLQAVELQGENASLRSRLANMEDAMRDMRTRMDEQDWRLRRAEAAAGR